MKKAFVAAFVTAAWVAIGCAIALLGPDPRLSANDNATALQAGLVTAGIGLFGFAISVTWFIAKFREWRDSRSVTFIFWG